MSKVNSYLLNSLTWNLGQMTNLIKMVRARVGDIKFPSWRHPLLSCGELDAFRLLEETKDCDRYTYLLELTFDRLLYILNLIINYLEGCNALAKFKPGKNVERPSNLSMASLLFMIWERIQVQCETHKDTPKIIHGRCTSSSSTQSDNTSFASCTTCELAQKLVTDIVLKVENYLMDDASEPAFITERKMLKERLVTASSWSAMMTWVNVVLNDITTLCEDVRKYKTEYLKMKHILDYGDSGSMKKIKKYEEEIKTLQKTFKDSEEKLLCMENEIKTLKDEREKQQEELNYLNDEYTKNMANLEAKKKSLEDEMAARNKMDREKTSEWGTKLEAEARKRDFLKKDAESIKYSFAEMEGQVAEANYKCTVLQAELEEAKEEVKSLRQEKERLLASLNEKQREIDKFSRKLLEAFPDISEENENKYKGTGDPLTDMRHQIEANKLRISQLLLHNENLQSTISRIEAVKK
ncbi:UNVERIFIED_CONTAM: hypothetical protein PYX00_005326 [Menopon gallinae]|uniref:Uncharacterized protein n=1 Tax=Menopon gallinae TaxID=328185 RepID=A0AAW2HS39_9NEOP